jgi:hypothetical protein
MPEDIALYRVFIATPGGLETERRVFARTLDRYNIAEAIHRQAMFFPVGWEDTLAGVGRPQSLINRDLDKCDYFVLVLWVTSASWAASIASSKLTRPASF